MVTYYSINTTHGFTINLYTKGLENKIGIVSYKSGVPSKDTQPKPQVSLSPGGMVQAWVGHFVTPITPS